MNSFWNSFWKKNAIQAHLFILLVVLEIRVQTFYLHYKHYYKVLECFNLSSRFFFCYYSRLKCFILMLTVVTIGAHSSTSPTRGFSLFCFLFPDALITWMTLKYKQANRCAHNLVALLVKGNNCRKRGFVCYYWDSVLSATRWWYYQKVDWKVLPKITWETAYSCRERPDGAGFMFGLAWQIFQPLFWSTDMPASLWLLTAKGQWIWSCSTEELLGLHLPPNEPSA